MEPHFPNMVADISHLESVQRLTIRLLRGLLHVPFEERLRHIELLSLEHSRLILAFTMLGHTKELLCLL